MDFGQRPLEAGATGQTEGGQRSSAGRVMLDRQTRQNRGRSHQVSPCLDVWVRDTRVATRVPGRSKPEITPPPVVSEPVQVTRFKRITCPKGQVSTLAKRSPASPPPDTYSFSTRTITAENRFFVSKALSVTSVVLSPLRDDDRPRSPAAAPRLAARANAERPQHRSRQAKLGPPEERERRLQRLEPGVQDRRDRVERKQAPARPTGSRTVQIDLRVFQVSPPGSAGLPAQANLRRFLKL